jgi:hypothetical protein
MQLKDLDEIMRRRPFRPFRVTVSTQEFFDVLHPEMIIIGERFVAIGKSEEPFEHDLSMYWIDYNHIVHIHRLDIRE